MKTAARVSYLFKLDPAMLLSEREQLRSQVREAAALVIVRDREAAMEEARG